MMLTPVSDGGEYTSGNGQLLFPACNRIRGDRDMEYLKIRRWSQACSTAHDKHRG